jgi:antitoxin HigA-1
MPRIKTHPGEVLLEDFLKPMGLNANLLSKAIGVPRNRITMILRGERGVTPDTALRLAQFFGTSAEVWTNLQMAHDLSAVEAQAPEIKNIAAFVAAE